MDKSEENYQFAAAAAASLLTGKRVYYENPLVNHDEKTHEPYILLCKIFSPMNDEAADSMVQMERNNNNGKRAIHRKDSADRMADYISEVLDQEVANSAVENSYLRVFGKSSETIDEFLDEKFTNFFTSTSWFSDVSDTMLMDDYTFVIRVYGVVDPENVDAAVEEYQEFFTMQKLIYEI